MMNLQETVLDNLKDLAVDQQKAVLDFILFLKFQQENKPNCKKSLRGLWSDLNFSITENDLISARKEMWGNFPREMEL